MDFILIYVTHPDQKAAEKICNHLLERRMIACVNYFPITSASWWTGKIARCDEIVSVLKTRKGNWDQVKSEVKRLHPYKIPCIMKFPVEANKEYEDWIQDETQPVKALKQKNKK